MVLLPLAIIFHHLILYMFHLYKLLVSHASNYRGKLDSKTSQKGCDIKMKENKEGFCRFTINIKLIVMPYDSQMNIKRFRCYCNLGFGRYSCLIAAIVVHESF